MEIETGHVELWAQRVALVFAVLCVGGCSHSNDDQNDAVPAARIPVDTHYWLVVSTHKLDDDSQICLTGDTTGGQITVLVNESPLGIYTSGFAHRITELVENGSNSVAIKGTHTKRLFAKVYTTSNANIEPGETPDELKCLARCGMEPDSTESHLAFDGEIPFAPPFDRISDYCPSNERLERELREKFQEVSKCIEERRIDGLREIFATPIALPWFFKWDNVAMRENYELRYRRLAKLVADQDVEVASGVDEVKFIIGKRLVFAYSGSMKNVFGDPVMYLFKVRVGETTARVGPDSLFLQKGKWRDGW